MIELARQSRRDGQPALADPLLRDQLVALLIEEQGDRLCVARARHPALVSERPASLPLSGKLRSTEHKRRLAQLAIALQGANGARFFGDAHAPAGGLWQRAYMNAFSATIGGGTSQVQANIVGERVLGLPKDPGRA